MQSGAIYERIGNTDVHRLVPTGVAADLSRVRPTCDPLSAAARGVGTRPSSVIVRQALQRRSCSWSIATAGPPAGPHQCVRGATP